MPKTSEREERKTSSHDERKEIEKRGGKLSPSTMRAKWISSTDEHAERKGQTLATRDHDVIRRWAADREARPATVIGTEHGKRAGVLRFAFNGQDSKRLQAIDWDEWFDTFDGRDLVFLYQEHLRSGNQSNFFRFDSPHREDA